jgi:hypothetical protein
MADHDSDDDSTSSSDSGSGRSVTVAVSVEKSPPEASCSSFTSPVAAKKKVFRRTNAQIEVDTATKQAALATKAALSASKESLKRKVDVLSEEASILVKDTKFSVQQTRSNWSIEEQICLIKSYRKREIACEKSQDKKLLQVSKMWLVEIPWLMGKEYGKVECNGIITLQSEMAGYSKESERLQGCSTRW